MKKRFALATIPAVIMTLAVAVAEDGAQAAAGECIALGGMGFANAIDETNLVGALSGGLAGGARAVIRTQEETESGLLLNMAHHFYTDAGGLLQTQDVAVLTAVAGRENTYMLEIAYDIVEASGALAGYGGDFRSFGLIKLDEGEVVLRYRGEICR